MESIRFLTSATGKKRRPASIMRPRWDQSGASRTEMSACGRPPPPAATSCDSVVSPAKAPYTLRAVSFTAGEAEEARRVYE